MEEEEEEHVMPYQEQRWWSGDHEERELRGSLREYLRERRARDWRGRERVDEKREAMRERRRRRGKAMSVTMVTVTRGEFKSGERRREEVHDWFNWGVSS